MAEKRGRRRGKATDGLDADFGPGFEAPAASKRGARGAEVPGEAAGAGPKDGGAPFVGGMPCGKDGCVLRPLGDLAARFALGLARRGHADTAARAATSAIELLRALRDFLDEEIAFAERAAEARRSTGRYTKIPVD